MKKIKILTLILVCISILSCHNDDNELAFKTKIIKNVTKSTNTPYQGYNHSFEFNNGLLISATGNTPFVGEYEYDSSGRIKKRIQNNNTYEYKYDTLNRIVRVNTVGNERYFELSYQTNKVITKAYVYYDYNNTTSITDYELQLDDKGRIIKATYLTPDNIHNIEYKKYTYDSRGNITEIITKYENKQIKSIDKYFYDDKINPYYVSFKKHNSLTYYLNNLSGIELTNASGLTPNNITRLNNTMYNDIWIIKYVYDNDGYPISYKRHLCLVNGSEPDIIIEYY
ncbi:hypothetical protein GGR32_002184 [Mesonia hippocampi]|uniref:YD repeat-containing protein n=1 Tax=Mesonia hippocampi TaxID=1628250 RepID=A0A840ETM2_9FLAO|nr:hypothetical protein [Mesonia hippocampi]MBB4119873.1 hypothetical protein [Mesonia hippocampi]